MMLKHLDRILKSRQNNLMTTDKRAVNKAQCVVWVCDRVCDKGCTLPWLSCFLFFSHYRLKYFFRLTFLRYENSKINLLQ